MCQNEKHSIFLLQDTRFVHHVCSDSHFPGIFQHFYLPSGVGQHSSEQVQGHHCGGVYLLLLVCRIPYLVYGKCVISLCLNSILNPLPDDKILDRSNLKQSADYNFRFDEYSR